MSIPVLSLVHVNKYFGRQKAVNDLSMDIAPGSITGFLGPNGAGKSTSLRLGLGIVPPTSGTVELFGAAPSYEALDRVGFLPEERGLYRKMKVLAVITYFGQLKGLSAKTARDRAMDLLDRLGLADAAGKKVSELSKGMAQKVQIVSALVHEPEFVILDEPFSGLDPVNQKVLEELVRELRAKGTTVLFSTHVMEHAERLCDRIVLLSRGSKVFDGSVEAALDTLPRRVRLDTEIGQNPVSALDGMAVAITEIPVPADLPAHGQVSRFSVDLSPGVDVQDVLKACVQSGVGLRGFEPAQRHLHDVFVNLVEGQG